MINANMNPWLKAGVVVVLAVVNYFGLLWSISFTSTLPVQTFLLDLGVSEHPAAVAHLVGIHTLAVLIVALPIALILPLIFTRYLLLAGVLVSLMPVVEVFVGLLKIPAELHSHIVWALTDVVKLLIFIPLLSWIFYKLLPYPVVARRGGDTEP